MTDTLLLAGPAGNLGVAVANRFGREGWKLALLGRSRAKLEAQAEELRGRGIETDIDVAELTDVAATQAAVNRLIERNGPPSLYVYNAAAVKRGNILQMPPGEIASDLLTTAGGGMASAQAALPSMLAKRAGSMIFSGGGLTIETRPEFTALTVGKLALAGFVRLLAADPALTAIHFADVIISASITPKVGEDIAEIYWTLHHEPKEAWRTLVEFHAPWGGG